MIWLVSGVALWAIMHFVPTLLPGMRSNLIASLGEKPYSGIFALVVLFALIMIVVGWRTTVPVVLYAPPWWGQNFAILLMFASINLFGAAHAKTNIKRVIRHPMLTGMLFWAIAHISANGDIRSLILFGGLGLWSAAEMSLINKREGVWVKPEKASLRSEAIAATVSIVVFLVLIALHPYFAGVSPLPV